MPAKTALVAKKKPARSLATGKKAVTKKRAVKKDVQKKPTPRRAVAARADSAPKKTKPANNKTQENETSVEGFLASLTDPVRQADARIVLALMTGATGEMPRMWGSAIVGFGKCRLVYESGRAMDWMLVGFSPRKQNLVLYLMNGFPEHADLLKRLGTHSTGKSCLYINRLADVNIKVLTEMVVRSTKAMRAKYPSA